MITARLIPWYGWQPDLPDARDLLRVIGPGKLPATVDLRDKMPAVYDQGELGSCTANAIAAVMEYDIKRQGLPDFTPSRLFVYYNERVIEGTTGTDAGAQLRDGIKTVAKDGVCAESLWPYKLSRFRSKPSTAAYTSAKDHPALKYSRVPRTYTGIRQCLSNGFPFVFGFTVYESFESPEVEKTGVLNLPEPAEKSLGGHAVAAVGYDGDRVIVRNSWGADWGQAGYFTMPVAYLLNENLADDFWQIEGIR